MIDVKVKIHDKFAFEFKISFVSTHKKEFFDKNDFSINTWIFVPNALDINRNTYTKENFYIDTKSNVRLITPVYSLSDISKAEDSPLRRLEKAILELCIDPTNSNLSQNYIYHIKMFSCVFKSSSRDRVYAIVEESDENRIFALVDEYILEVIDIIKAYRELREIFTDKKISEDDRLYFNFGDDFIGNILEQHSFRMMRQLENKHIYSKIKSKLYKLVESENAYRIRQKYSVLDTKNTTDNYLVVMRRDILKKFIESDLYLNTKKIKDGAFAEQFYYGIAAGVSMIFATVVAFTAQQRYGNFTTPLFFALVISYIFKDRIKDLMRYYFSTQLSKKYFDTKRELEIQDEEIGWTKESFDFVSEKKVPDEIMNLRKRSPLVEAENKIYNEQIILYRKLVQLSPSDIFEYNGYQFIGINDITRFNLTRFIQKMDNPSVPLYMPDETDGYICYNSEKVYVFYIIIRCESSQGLYFRKFRLLINREGIKEIKEISD